MSADPLDDKIGDPSLATQMRPALVRYFRRKTGSAVEAEDLAQDILVRALAHAKWRSPAEAKGYLFRIAVNRWRDLRRRQQIRGLKVAWDEETIDARFLEEHGAGNSPERVLIVQDELDRLVRALDGLNVRTRTVLMLVKLEGMRIATVAEMLGISLSAVNKHLARGLEYLAQWRSRQDGP